MNAFRKLNTIYVYDYIKNNATYKHSYEKLKYFSEHIPRIGEKLYFAHLGPFVVRDVAYRVSDDNEYNELMWVEVFVEEEK